MSAVIHFEIHANDVPRAVAFYQAIFGWEVQDWSEYAGMPYFGVVTRPEGEPGINGAIMARMGPGPQPGGRAGRTQSGGGGDGAVKLVVTFDETSTLKYVSLETL
ncbi:MAG: hypothetical protein IPP00_05220 [Actinomycetales bacterium]|uniref:Glyoxalase/Bleomycin resistance-like N-terminal domain-containing protein n=1 Tax=Candidatus Phosphoribacter hodrii TaxID=2953743 RepID=A0A9D7T679_9MICO|nr:hypothetical protein [Candidatus Phosphoribacter hodrii]